MSSISLLVLWVPERGSSSRLREMNTMCPFQMFIRHLEIGMEDRVDREIVSCAVTIL